MVEQRVRIQIGDVILLPSIRPLGKPQRGRFVITRVVDVLVGSTHVIAARVNKAGAFIEAPRHFWIRHDGTVAGHPGAVIAGKLREDSTKVLFTSE